MGQLSSWLRIIQIPVDITVLKYDHYFICTGFFPSTCPGHLQQDRQFRKTNQQLTFQHAPTIPYFTFPMYPLLISKHNRNVNLFKAFRVPMMTRYLPIPIIARNITVWLLIHINKKLNYYIANLTIGFHITLFRAKASPTNVFGATVFSSIFFRQNYLENLTFIKIKGIM